MSKGGLSQARLQRLQDVAQESVDQGHLAGAITLVERHGETHIAIVGQQDRERDIAMKQDTIFRLASMSKPIAAAAAMILVEEGTLRLDDPIQGLIPELADRKVIKNIDGPLDDTVPAARPITLRDCLTFRLGYGMLGFGPGRTPLEKAWADAGLGFGGRGGYDSDGLVKRLAGLPLVHQPGERVLYHTGSDVTGILVERATGKSFEDFMKERLFEPLGMKDTGFSVAPEKVDRFSSCYGFDFQTREMTLQDDARGNDSRYTSPPKFQSGGGGLLSTLDDYLAFGRMMLNKGKLGKERILSRPTVEAMTTNYLTDEQRRTAGWFPGSWDGRGWGFGMAVVVDRIGPSMSPGRFGWDGAYGTQWWADPAEEMNCILMIQRAGGPMGGIAADFLTLAYTAIDD